MIEIENDDAATGLALSTGSTLLNLAISDQPTIGFSVGRYFYMVGDSTSGKTFLSMTLLAEASIREEFKGYRFIYDNIEDGMLMDVDKLFGEEVADRLEAPEVKDGIPVFSDTIESFYFHLDDAIRKAGWDSSKRQPSNVKDPKPFIFILDSMDALDSEGGDKKFDQQKKSFYKKRGQAGEEVEDGEQEKVAGSYGVDKAKRNSEYLRKCLKGLKQTGGILIILSQTRADLGGMGKTRSGGWALRFYATMEIWSSVVKKLTKVVNDKPRDIGVRVKLQVRKNRVTGKLNSVEVDIFPDYGFDDLGSCVDYLVEEGWWKQEKLTIDAKEVGIKGTREKLIRYVETNKLEGKVQAACGACWESVLKACALKRKSRYGEVTEPG